MADASDVDVEHALTAWQQGDVAVGLSVFSIMNRSGADGEEPDFAADGEYAGAVVISQTCDIVRSPATHAYVNVVPWVTLDDEHADLARKRRLGRYAHLPGLGPNEFADLSIVMTVEKPALVTCRRRRGCPTDAQIRIFADALKKRWGRFAFPDEVNVLLKPLLTKVKDKRNGAIIDKIVVIVCDVDPEWTNGRSRIVLYFLVATDMPESEIESLRVTIEKWCEKCNDPKGEPRVLSLVYRLNEISAGDYRRLVELDLEFLSPEAAAGE